MSICLTYIQQVSGWKSNPKSFYVANNVMLLPLSLRSGNLDVAEHMADWPFIVWTTRIRFQTSVECLLIEKKNSVQTVSGPELDSYGVTVKMALTQVVW